MTASLMDGRALAEAWRAALVPRVQAVRARLGRPPGLGVILVGEDPASALYVRNKVRAAHKVGLHSQVMRLPDTARMADVAAAVAAFNADGAIDAFLLQLPLPAHLDADALMRAIDPRKDADGLHPHNVAALVGGRVAPRPCTPLGCLALLDAAGVALEGAHAVVVGRSAIVGKPLALLLSARNATVTLCHQKTRDLAQHVGQADVLVVAVGRPELVDGAWIKPGAAVVDVGINRVTRPDGTHALCGDVAFAAAQRRAGWITPVPGGVGPMTIAMLLENAVAAAEAAGGAP